MPDLGSGSITPRWQQQEVVLIRNYFIEFHPRGEDFAIHCQSSLILIAYQILVECVVLESLFVGQYLICHLLAALFWTSLSVFYLNPEISFPRFSLNIQCLSLYHKPA